MSERKTKIENLVKFYKEQFPLEYNLAIKRAKKVRDTKANIYGSDIDKDFRHEFSMPAKLFDLINSSLESPFLKDNSEAAWFRKTFPEFGGSEKW